jgi:hypothetical protein
MGEPENELATSVKKLLEEGYMENCRNFVKYC